jgi:hypothetical protein
MLSLARAEVGRKSPRTMPTPAATGIVVTVGWIAETAL